MTRHADVELQTWGRMLFAHAKPGPRHPSRGVRIPTSDVVRRELRLAVKRAPQVMVKVTGGGRRMAVIRAHMNYIDREGDGLIDQDGERHQGREARRKIAERLAEFAERASETRMHATCFTSNQDTRRFKRKAVVDW